MTLKNQYRYERCSSGLSGDRLKEWKVGIAGSYREGFNQMFIEVGSANARFMMLWQLLFIYHFCTLSKDEENPGGLECEMSQTCCGCVWPHNYWGETAASAFS